jgi:hypothetical protein
MKLTQSDKPHRRVESDARLQDGWLNAVEARFVRRSMLARQTFAFAVFAAFIALASLTWFAFSERDRAENNALKFRKQRDEATRLSNLSLAQSLAAQGPRLQDEYALDERGALLARQAYSSISRTTAIPSLRSMHLCARCSASLTSARS